jgi:hypothetical protein
MRAGVETGSRVPLQDADGVAPFCDRTGAGKPRDTRADDGDVDLFHFANLK